MKVLVCMLWCVREISVRSRIRCELFLSLSLWFWLISSSCSITPARWDICCLMHSLTLIMLQGTLFLCLYTYKKAIILILKSIIDFFCLHVNTRVSYVPQPKTLSELQECSALLSTVFISYILSRANFFHITVRWQITREV